MTKKGTKRREWMIVLAALLFLALVFAGYLYYDDVDFSPSSGYTKDSALIFAEQCINNYPSGFEEESLECKCLTLRLMIRKLLITERCDEGSMMEKCGAYERCLESNNEEECSALKKELCEVQNDAECKNAVDKYNEVVDRYNDLKCRKDGTLVPYYNLFTCRINGNEVC